MEGIQADFKGVNGLTIAGLLLTSSSFTNVTARRTFLAVAQQLTNNYPTLAQHFSVTWDVIALLKDLASILLPNFDNAFL